MKGILFTITIFIIFGFIVAYFATINTSLIERSRIVADKVAAQRIYYMWKGVADNVISIFNVSIGKNDTMAIFNDTLPALSNIGSMLGWYQDFINQNIVEQTLNITFEDANGNPVILNQTDSKIVIKPMNINYSWPDYGKNQLFITSTPANFSYINNVDVYVKLKNVFFNCDVNKPGDCNKWSPDNRVPSCSGIQYCLNLNLTFEDANNVVFNYPDHYFDIGGTKKSTTNLDVKNTTAAYTIFIQVGPLASNIVLNIDLKSTQVNTFTTINFTTSDFYIDFPTKLNVSTAFGKKVDFI